MTKHGPPLAALFIAVLALALAGVLVAADGQAGTQTAVAARAAAQPARADILVDTGFDSQYTIARLEIPERLRNADWHYLWTVPAAIGSGNGPDSGAVLYAVFATAGRHEATVLALNLANTVVGEAKGTIEVVQAAAMGPGRSPGPYRTLEGTGSLLAIDGSIRGVTGGSQADFPLVARAGRFSIHRAATSGYFLLDIDGLWRSNVFVSPVPSYHIDRSDRDWYLTQFNTETTSNCGPSATAMGINWAKGIDISVVDIRKLVGWEGTGAVSLEQLKRVCDLEGVRATIRNLRRPADIFELLASDRLLIVSYDMVGVSPVDDPVHNLLGQYYYDQGGHYLILKGFSLDHRYVIVYDPIPSDWAQNAQRYPDGVSMLGRNRYYPIDELWQALNARRALVIEAD